MWGVVSNCWRVQLEGGQLLEELISEAVTRNYRAIELRQTCLGSFEVDQVPQADRMATLPERFPEVQFNLAINVPFLLPGFSPTDGMFAAGQRAACALAGKGRPHLRLVDLVTREVRATADDFSALADAMRNLGGILSLEVAHQRWEDFYPAVAAARMQLGLQKACLQLCYDPCNLQASGHVDIEAITASLTADQLSMVHLKQRRAGRPLVSVEAGEVDWQTQVKRMRQIGYRGPWLLEIDPHDQVWAHLDSSRAYIQSLGAGEGEE